MKPKILVVEDEPSIAENVVFSLETDGFTPVLRDTGESALTSLREDGNFSLVVLDIGLPDTDGFEVCKEIRKFSSIPILFLTAREGEIDRVVGLEIGGDDYMCKPFSPRELVARIKAILRRTAPTGEDSQSLSSKQSPADTKKNKGSLIEYGPFSMDSERLRVTYFGEALSLTRYEFRLLQVLLGAPGRVFTRDQLMERAWDEPEAAMDRTVDTHIKSLRARLRTVRDGLQPIQTHRGVGYALDDRLN